MPTIRAAALLLLVLTTACSSATAPAAAPAPTSPPPAPATTPTAAASADVLPITIGYSAMVASQSLAWIALQTGLFDKHGLEVHEIPYFNSSSQATAALLSGSVDTVITGGIGIMSAVVEGADLKLIAASKNQLAGKIMARPGINSVEDLRGKQVVVGARGSNTEYMAIQVLRRSGLEVGRDFSFVYAGGSPEVAAALSADAAQASAVVAPDDKRAADVGAHELVDVTRMVLKYPATNLAVSGKVLRERPEALRRLVEALKDAVQVYKSDPDTALRVISGYTKQTPEALRPAYEEERSIMADQLRVDPESIAAAIEDIAKDKPAIRGKSYEDFVDSRFVN
jgi:NitT/TauT family transport system substrate-binding protein